MGQWQGSDSIIGSTPLAQIKLDAERSWDTLIILSFGVHAQRCRQTFVRMHVLCTDRLSCSLSLLSHNLTDNKHYETTMDTGASGFSVFGDSITSRTKVRRVECSLFEKLFDFRGNSLKKESLRSLGNTRECNYRGNHCNREPSCTGIWPRLRQLPLR